MESAMVQIMENHAEICAEVLSAAADPERPGFVALRVRVRSSKPIENYSDMFARDVGQIITLLARADSMAAGQVGHSVKLLVRKAGPALSFVDTPS